VRHLQRRAADTPRAHLDEGLHVVDRVGEGVDRLAVGDLLPSAGRTPRRRTAVAVLFLPSLITQLMKRATSLLPYFGSGRRNFSVDSYFRGMGLLRVVVGCERRGSGLRTLGAVERAALLAVGDAAGVEGGRG